MAPTDALLNRLSSRYICYGDDCDNWGNWYYWGRWVVLGVIILVFFVVLISCSFMARRRRRRGLQPWYGTGWLAGNRNYGAQQSYPMNNYNNAGYGQGGYPQQYPQDGYQPNQYGHYKPPPAYGQQNPGYGQPQQSPYGQEYPVDAGYYGGQGAQQTGLQSPSQSYQRDGVYSPPPGPPPAKQ